MWCLLTSKSALWVGVVFWIKSGGPRGLDEGTEGAVGWVLLVKGRSSSGQFVVWSFSGAVKRLVSSHWTRKQETQYTVLKCLVHTTYYELFQIFSHTASSVIIYFNTTYILDWRSAVSEPEHNNLSYVSQKFWSTVKSLKPIDPMLKIFSIDRLFVLFMFIAVHSDKSNPTGPVNTNFRLLLNV